MAETPQAEHTGALIPYPFPPNGDVVLRRGDAVVVFDAHSQQLSVRDAPDHPLDLNECPYCHRPFHQDADSSDDDEQQRPRSRSRGANDRSYVDPNYFRMLAASQRPSPASTGPSTPNPRFFPQPALRSGRSRDVSGAYAPPSSTSSPSQPPTSAPREPISSSAFSPGYFKQFFRELRILGRGGNGVVLLVEHIMDSISLGQFACKRVPVGNNHAWLEKVLVEVKLLQKIPHRNLVAYHWVWLEDHQPSAFSPSIPCLWILQEYCNGGDLHAYVLGASQPPSSPIQNFKRRRSTTSPSTPPSMRQLLSFDDIFSFFRDITAGLHHLHAKGYIHRDLKPSNILLHHSPPYPRPRVLISDFGEAQTTTSHRRSTGATGTISYCAPEVLVRNPDNPETFNPFTTKSDIFSLGMIVYFMCFARLPYAHTSAMSEDSEDLDALRAEISRWPGFDEQIRQRPDLPERLYRYLKRLLSVDPAERPGTDEILASIKGGDVTASFVEETTTSSRVSQVGQLTSSKANHTAKR